jgi:hypothetical protein
MTPAENLTQRLGGRWNAGERYGTARCPAHDDHNPSLTLRDGDKGILLKCHAGCTSQAVVDTLKACGWWGVSPPKRRKPKRSEEDRRRYVIDVWRSCGPIGGTVAETYLRHRGITIELPPSLRFHPRLRHSDTLLLLPCMVGAVQGPDRSIIGLHRTYLRQDGEDKAGVTRPRMFLGNVRGGASGWPQSGAAWRSAKVSKPAFFTSS